LAAFCGERNITPPTEGTKNTEEMSGLKLITVTGRRKTMRIRILLIALIIAALPVAAFAAVGGGGTNTTTYSTSTRTISDTTNIAVTQQVDTFAVELIVRMQGGSTLYDQTFNVAFADPTVQAALVTAQGVLTANGAASFLQNLLSTNTSLFGSVLQTGSPVTTGTDVSATTTMYIGPQTIMVGDNQSQAFTIVAGGIDYDTLVTTLIYQTITTTTTDTYFTNEVYELIGIPTATSVPEPGTLGLLAMGLIAVVGSVLRRKTRI
jgi:hypothetical protein